MRLLEKAFIAARRFFFAAGIAVGVVIGGAWTLAILGFIDNPGEITAAVWTVLFGELEGWRNLLAIATGGVFGFFVLGEITPGGGDGGGAE